MTESIQKYFKMGTIRWMTYPGTADKQGIIDTCHKIACDDYFDAIEITQFPDDECRDACKAMFEQGTHFNPVDLVCAVKNHKGEKYNLPEYVDKNTGFISFKSKDGRELKALELPGLWNGAMSNWNTVFVEVPIETFNPVKTVNDLLRPEHQ